MPYKYSKSTGAFYCDTIHGANIPEDSIEITDAQHLEYHSARAAGKIILVDENGGVTIVDPSAPSADELRAKELSALFEQWQADLTALQFAWVSALREDGESENLRKADISAEIEELQIQYQSDVAAVKLKYNEA